MPSTSIPRIAVRFSRGSLFIHRIIAPGGFGVKHFVLFDFSTERWTTMVHWQYGHRLKHHKEQNRWTS